MRGALTKILSLSAVLLLSGCGGGAVSSSFSASASSSREIDVETEWSLKSPDSSIVLTVSLSNDGSVYYRAGKDGQAVVDNSKLGFVFEEADLSSFLTFFSKEERSGVAISYDNISGKKSHVETSFNELKLTFLEFDYYLDITLRGYNDGYAIRYGIRQAKDEAATTISWKSECTEFALPAKSKTYAMAYKASTTEDDGRSCYSYEDYYSYRRSDRLSAGVYQMPFSYETAEGVYGLISESGLIGSGYHGSFLENNADGILATVHSPASGINPDKTVELPFVSPWRVEAVGSLKTTVETTIFEDVYDEIEPWKPSNYDELSAEEQANYDYSWVEPDVTAWNWLYYTGTTLQSDYSLQRKYIDLARDMGWKWSILDGGWQGEHTDSEIKELCSYAKSQGVKMVAWGHAFNDFGTLASMKLTLKKWKRLGIDGVKVDFWDGQAATLSPKGQMEDKQCLEQYETFYQTAASLQMVVNCHGANKPTGERRLYPNVIAREAVRGNEFKSVGTDQTVFDSLIRGAVGPTDFTPVVVPFRSGITIAHQMALPILLECGMPSMADVETRYKEENYNAFYKDLPAAWDDIKFVDGGLETHAVIARKKGDNWWVGGITSKSAMSIALDLSFLGEGTYNATIYSDATSQETSGVALDSQSVTSATKLDVSMIENGGFALTLKKA